jgi:hypothetical protein
MPKIVQYNLPPGGTHVQLADNVEVALDIETTAGEDWILIDTETGAEAMTLAGGNFPVKIGTAARGPQLRQGHAGASQPGFPVYTFRGDTNTGMTDTGTEDQLSLVAGGVEAIRCVEDGGAAVIQFGQDNYDPQIEQGSGSGFGYTFKGDTNTGMTSGGESDTLYLTAGNTRAIYIAESGAIATTQIDGPAKVLGAFAAQGSGTVGTGGSSSTTLEQSGASTFQTELHVGAAIKIISGGVIKKATVASITDANTLELDSAETIADGSNWYYDSGELFAVKSGDSKSILAVTGEGGLVLNSSGVDSGIYNNLAIGDSDILSKATTANRNYIIGHSNGDWDLTSADSCVIMGYNTAATLTSGSNNTIIGGYAGDSVTTQQNITALGAAAGRTSGSHSTHVGQNAGTGASGSNNVSVGKDAMSAFTGADSVAMGKEALDATASNYATSIGYQSLTGLTATTTHNTALGYRAGLGLDDGNQCVFLGSTADTSDTDGDNQIAIGYGAVCDAPNKIMMGNHRTTDMAMDCPPITVKQTSTDGAGISIEHEGSSNAIVELGEVDDAGRIELKKGSDGTVIHRFRFGSSSWINNNTTYMLGVSTNSPNSNFHSGGTNAYAVTAGGSLITSSHTVGTHSTMLYNASGGDITATLPAASGVAGRVYTFKLVTKGGNDLIIASNGSETIEGSTSNFTVDTEKEAVTIQSDGVGWQVIGKYLT